MADTLLATLVLLPAVLTFLLKSNGAVSFLAICGGFAASTISGSDIEQLVGKTRVTSLTSNDIYLLLLVVPLLLTIIFTYHSVKGKGLRFWHILPALCAGGILAVAAGPLFNDTLNIAVSQAQFWKDLQRTQSYIVGAGLLVSLLLIWSGGFTGVKRGKKHK